MAVNKIKNMRVHDILNRVDEAKTRKEKIQILQDYNHLGLRDVLRGAFDDSIEFNLPEGDPPYTPGSEAAPGTSLLKQTKKFKYFIKTPQRPKADAKVETIFIQMLERLHPQEAQIAVWMKDKNLSGKYKGLTKKLVIEAFPGLIRE